MDWSEMSKVYESFFEPKREKRGRNNKSQGKPIRNAISYVFNNTRGG